MGIGLLAVYLSCATGKSIWAGIGCDPASSGAYGDACYYGDMEGHLYSSHHLEG